MVVDTYHLTASSLEMTSKLDPPGKKAHGHLVRPARVSSSQGFVASIDSGTLG